MSSSVAPIASTAADSPGARRRAGLMAGAGAGLAAAGAGLGVAELVATASPRMRSPVLDVGDRVVDAVPGWLKDLAIAWFGTADKIALLCGIGTILVLGAALLGVLALRRSTPLGVAGIAVFAAAGAVAGLAGRTGADPLAAVPALAGGAVAAAALLWLARIEREGAAGGPSGTRSLQDRLERRRFVVGLAAVGTAGVVAAATGRRLASRLSADGSRDAVALPLADVPAPPVPAGADVADAAPLFTPNDTFYRIDTALAVPQVPAESWELRVTGLVDQELTLTYDQLLERELVEADITLTCVSNLVGGELVGTARWLGVRLDYLLDEAGIATDADQIVGRSADGYTCGFPVAALDGRDALVAIGMNGEPLPLDHGFPARLIVPGIYGYASATKWLTEIELTRFDTFDHYWVPRGYAAEAPIKLQSRIDTPRGLDRIPAGPTAIAGVAWAQPVGVDGVEVRIDTERWQPAELAPEVNASTWRQWRLDWDATPGRHSIEVRAIDRTGAIQTADRTEPLPDGATGNHKVIVLVDEG